MVAAGPPDIQVEGAFFEMAEVALRRRGASGDFFRLKDFAARGVKVNPTLRTANIEDVVTHEGRVVAERDEKGVIDLTTLVAAAPVTARLPPRVATGWGQHRRRQRRSTGATPGPSVWRTCE